MKSKESKRLREVKALWNQCLNIHDRNQASAGLTSQIMGSKPMDFDETQKAKKAGLNVKDGYVKR